MNSLCFVFPTVGAIINARVQGTRIEPEVPKMVKACTGSHTTISCMFHTDVKGLKVAWYFDKTSDFNDRKNINELHSPPGSNVRHYHEEKGHTASYLTIRNVTLNDSGWYFCQVTQDIPILISNLSNGSELVICKYYFIYIYTHTHTLSSFPLSSSLLSCDFLFFFFFSCCREPEPHNMHCSVQIVRYFVHKENKPEI